MKLSRPLISFTHFRPSLPAVLLAFATAFGSSSAFAGNTWTGGGGTPFNWSDSANWGGIQPAYGTLTFAGTLGTTNTLDANYSMNILDWTGTSAWTLNSSNGAVLSLFDSGGLQAKLQNDSTGLVTINAPITFAANNANPTNPFGEINAVSGDMLFGTGTLTVSGSSVNGIKLFGSNHTTTFNNTVSATGKWFALTGTNTTMSVGGAFTSGDIYVMNGSTLKLNAGGTITSTAIRLGGDFGKTGNLDQTKSGTLQLTPLTGGLTLNSIINSVAGNSSGTLLIDSQNTSSANTISGNIFLDSGLRINQAAGGTLSITNATLDLKAQTLTLTGTATGNIGITGVIGNSTGNGQLVVGVNGTAGGPVATLSGANTYSGETFVRAGTLAFTSTGDAANTTIRLGSSSGTSVDANINLTTLTGGTTISSVVNPVSTTGSGTLTINSQNTSGTNTFSNHFGEDRNLTINQATGGTLAFTQARAGGTGSSTGFDIKGTTVTLGGGGNIIFGDVYASTGSGTLVSGSTGIVTLGGSFDNTSIGVTVNSGTLVLNKASASGVHAFGNASSVNSGATLQLGGSGGDQIYTTVDLTINGIFDLNGKNEGFDELAGSGTVRNTANGTTSILTLGENLGVTPTGFTGIIQDNAGGGQTGTVAITKTGTGSQRLAGANTYTGLTAVNGGQIIVQNNLALGSTAGQTTVASGASVALVNGITVTGETITISGTGDPNNAPDTGALRAATSAVATWAGPVILGDATARIGTSNSGTLTVSGGIQGSGTNQTLSIGGGLSGSANGTIILSAPSGQNTYTGLTNIFRGTLKVGATDSLPVGTIVDVHSGSSGINTTDSALFDLNGFNQTIGGLQRTDTTGTGASTVTNSVASLKTLTVSGATSTTFSGVIGGAANLALTKGGTSTLTLTGSNTYTGQTIISANGGTLKVDNNNSTTFGKLTGSNAANSITVNNSGTLLLSGAGTNDRIGNTTGTTLATGGTLAIGPTATGSANAVLEGTGAHNQAGTFTGTNASGLGALTLTGNATLDMGANGVGTLNFASFTSGGFTLNITNYFSNVTNPTANISGTDGVDDRLIFATDQNANLAFFSFGGISAKEISLGGTFYEIVPITPVPEPATYIAGLLTLGTLGWKLRRRFGASRAT